MNKRWKWIVSLGTVFLLVFFSGYHFLKPYYRFRFSPVEVTKVNAMTTIRKVVPGGPARFLSQDGDYIVGIGQVSSLDTDWSIYLYDTNGTLNDITDDTYTSIFTTDEGMISNTMIKGDYVTWTFQGTPCTKKYLSSYKISTQTITNICSTVHRGYYVRDGNNIVFSFDGANDLDIQLYNLSTNSGTNICTASGDQTSPDIKADTIVWLDTRNIQTTGYDIYRYDLSNSQEYVVANSAEDEYPPITNGDWIAYIRYNASSNPDSLEIRKYNILSSTDSVISSVTRFGVNSFLCDINDTSIAYELIDSNGDNNIYLYNLANSSSTLIETTSYPITGIKLGQTQLIYNINLGHQDLYKGKIYGYDPDTSTNYNIRTDGVTYYETSINKDTDYVIMTSKGVDNDPSEWDVSIAIIP